MVNLSQALVTLPILTNLLELLKITMVNLSQALATLPILANLLGPLVFLLLNTSIIWFCNILTKSSVSDEGYSRNMSHDTELHIYVFLFMFFVKKIDFNHYMRFTQDCIHRLLIPVQFWLSKKKFVLYIMS